MDDTSGIPWVFIHLGWVVLALVLAYGILRRGRLSRTEKAVQQDQVRENFRQDEDAA